MTDLPVVLVWGLKATPLLLGAWLGTALLRRTSAATRHFVWVLAIVGALALPVVTAVVPRWETPVLDWIRNADGASTEAERAEGTAGGGQVTEADWSAFQTADWSAFPAVVQEPSSTNPAPSSASDLSAPSLFALWSLGAGVVGLLVLLSFWRTQRLARRARPIAHRGVIAEAERIAAALGLRRRVALLQAPDEAMPMTWGALHPRVLLPASFAEWPADRRRAVLVHELAHVRRYDWLTQLIARAACAVYWWNPLAWVAARRLREERELACDDLVLAQGTVPSRYAGDLLEIARAFRATPATALAGVAMARRSQLAGRLLAVLDGSRVRGRVGVRPAATAATAFVAFFLPLAALATRDAATAGVEPTAVLPVASERPGAPESGPSSGSPPSSASAAVSESSAIRSAAQQARATLCDWTVRGGRRNSSSTNIDDDRMTMTIVRDDCTLKVDSDGKVTFTEDDRDIAGIGGGGFFEIEEREGRNRRRVEISAEGGGLERRWLVDGDEQPWGDPARAWLADALLVLVRRAGINAEARALRIFRQGGAEALIAEIDLLQSDYVAAQYYTVLFERADLTAAQQTRLLQNASERVSSDYELGRIMKALAARGRMEASVQRAYVQASESLDSDYEHRHALDALVKANDLDVTAMDAMLASARRLESDYERAELLVTTAARYPAGRPLPASYLTAVSDMDSDYEQRRVLDPLLTRDRLSPEDRARVLTVLTDMDSDYERAELLVSMVREAPIDDATRAAFFRAADRLDSDHERQRVLDAVIAGRPDEATTLAVIASARGINSDYSKAEVLVAVARRGLTGQVREAYLSAVDTIDSSYERDRARRAAGLRGT
jgi:beta-lactamase regulating signal transducer with metallopeptidase domain